MTFFSKIFSSSNQTIINQDIQLRDLTPPEIIEARETYHIWSNRPKHSSDIDYYRKDYLEKIVKIEKLFKIRGCTFSRSSDLYLKISESHKENKKYEKFIKEFTKEFDQFNQIIASENCTSQEIKQQLQTLVKAQTALSAAFAS